MAHQNFTVGSTEVIPGEMRVPLDRAEARLAASDIYEPRLHHRIYLANSPTLMR